MNKLWFLILVVITTDFLIVKGQDDTETSSVESVTQSENVAEAENVTKKRNVTQSGPPTKLPQNCAEAIRPWEPVEGVYKMEIPNSGLGTYYAYCIIDPDGGAAWTIIQRRMNGFVDFYRTWVEYQKGFGQRNGDYFLGLNHTHKILNATKNELWIQLVTFDNVTRYAKYDEFHIGNETDDYTLTVSGYSGTANDSLSYHSDNKFSTHDNDNDSTSDYNLAEELHGAWWLTRRSYEESHLNGLYGALGNHSGIAWLYDGSYGHYKYAHMAIRPVQYSPNYNDTNVAKITEPLATTEIPTVNG